MIFLSRVGVVIDFTNTELSLLTNSVDKTVDLMGRVNVGYLGGITEKTREHIMIAPVRI